MIEMWQQCGNALNPYDCGSKALVELGELNQMVMRVRRLSAAASVVLATASVGHAAVVNLGDPLGVFPTNLAVTPNVGNTDIYIGRLNIINGLPVPLNGDLVVDTAPGPNAISTDGNMHIGTRAGSVGNLTVNGDGTAGSASVTIGGNGFYIGNDTPGSRGANGTGSLKITNGGSVIAKPNPNLAYPVTFTYAGNGQDVNGLGSFEATIDVVGNGSSFSTDHLEIGNSITGATGQLQVLGGANVDIGFYRDLGGGLRYSGALDLQEGSNLLVSDAGSQIQTNRLIVGYGVNGFNVVANPNNAAATATIANGGKIFTGSSTDGAVIGYGGRADMLVTGAGSELSVFALPGDDGVGGTIIGDEGDLSIGLTNAQYDFATDSYRFDTASASLAILDFGLVSVEGDVRIGGTDSWRKTSIENFSPGVIVPSSQGVVEVSSGGQLVAQRVIVGENGLLKGNGGTITSNVFVNNGGTVAPGTSPGTMTIDGDLTFNGGSLFMEINGTGLGMFDQLFVTGGLFASSPFNIDISFGNMFLPKAGDHFDLLNIAGDSSILSNPGAYILNVLGLNNSLNLSMNLSNGIFGFDVVSAPDTPAPVPLPASLPALMAGIGLLGVVRKRRRLQAA